MSLANLWSGLAGMNLLGLRLMLRDRELARVYLSRCARLYDELAERGLPARDPLQFIYSHEWAAYTPNESVVVPPILSESGGTRLDEQLYLATVTRILRPRKIFEIGTFHGRTTSLFILNAPPETTVLTLDLPPETQVGETANYINSDVDLVRKRKLAHCVHELGLTNRYQQILCDSLQFDPAPHRQSVELGFIDGAHTRRYVENDTLKMAEMVAERGLVFWHDYGGKGAFKPLTDYLESLARQIPVYRVPGTSLAWAEASSLRTLLGVH